MSSAFPVWNLIVLKVSGSSVTLSLLFLMWKFVFLFWVWWRVILIILNIVSLTKQKFRDEYIQYKSKFASDCCILLYDVHNKSFFFYKFKIVVYNTGRLLNYLSSKLTKTLFTSYSERKIGSLF